MSDKKRDTVKRVTASEKLVARALLCSIGLAYLVAFFELDNLIQSILTFIWRGLGWGTAWIDQLNAGILVGTFVMFAASFALLWIRLEKKGI